MSIWMQPNDFPAPSRHTPLPPPSRERFAPSSRSAGFQGDDLQTRNGRLLHLRTISPDDVAALQRCFTRLAPDDIRRRFLHSMSQLPEPMAQRLCQIDPACESAYVLVDESVEPTELRGVGRIFVDDATDSAEFSILVERDWARLGLGARLMEELVAECRRRGLYELWGYVQLENRPMLSLCRELGFRQQLVFDEPGAAQITLAL